MSDDMRTPGDHGRLRSWFHAWWVTLRAQWNRDRRRVLRGRFDPNDYVEVGHDGGSLSSEAPDGR